MIRCLLIVCLGAALFGCSSTEGSPKPAAATSPARPSPLGVGHPDPQVLIAAILDGMKRRDFEGVCALLAGPGRNGLPVPLVPGRNIDRIPDDRRDLWPPMKELEGLRHFLDQPWKTIHYGPARNIGNDPPFISTTLRVTYDWDRIPDAERRLLIRSLSDRRGRQMSFEEVMREGRAREAAEASGTTPLPTLRFAHLLGNWRLYIGP